jgi:cell division protein FtsB
MMFQALVPMKAPFARLAFAIAFVVVCAYTFVTLRGPGGLQALFAKEAQIKEMERRNGALAKEIERKREHIKRLSENPSEQELEIRDRLKLVHPDEKVYIIGQPAKKEPAKR